MAAAIALFFLLAPLMNWLTGQTSYLESGLAVTEGVSRLQWVTFMIVVGTVCFYVAYFLTELKPVTLGFRDDSLPPGTWIIMTLALLAAAYAIVMFRGSSFALARDQVVIEGGGFTGDITGYQFFAHTFALFPLILLLAFKKTRKAGLLLMTCYVAARFEDRGNRQCTISLLLAASMLSVSLKKKQWPDLKWILVIASIMLILTIRGHSGLLDFWRSDSLDAQTAQNTIAGSGDTAMLSTLWVQAFLSDRMGFNYGIPFLNQVLFGALPRKYFPWKDSIIGLVAPMDTSNLYSEAMELMAGAKSTLIGDLYSWGGIIPVALGMACLGYLFRRLDGMLIDKAPLPVRLLGFLWLGSVWMFFASGLVWSAQSLFLTALPFVGLYYCEKFFGNPKIIEPQRLEKRKVGPLPDLGRVK